MGVGEQGRPSAADALLSGWKIVYSIQIADHPLIDTHTYTHGLRVSSLRLLTSPFMTGFFRTH